ncbi:MAG: family 16 glycoside hydrolase [Planctomycetota bacterium]
MLGSLALLTTLPVPAPGVEDELLDFSAPPASAVQLIGEDGHVLVPEGDGESRWTFADGVLTASPVWDSVLTPEPYADFRMHLEFAVNASDDENREKRGNSGLYVQQRYEVQILDSYGVPHEELQAWECGSLYRLEVPDQLACRPAERWQSYDVVFRAARFEGDRKVENARITVFHNDRLIHDDVALSRKTGAGKQEGPEPMPIKLQGHHNPVRFRNAWIEALELEAMPAVPADDPRRVQKALPRPGTTLRVEGYTAFVIEPPLAARRDGPMPWVWYAPTLAPYPGEAEGWMFDRLLASGVAIAGIDVGESYGSPDGTRLYRALYAHVRTARGYAARPALLARSRGGLMLYAWAAENPRRVAGIAGIYPVVDLASYPGLERAAPAFGQTAAELANDLEQVNPVDRLAPLAAAGVPILHLHGDSDSVVPLEANSGALAERYRALGGPVDVRVFEGRGHDMWDGWFRSEELVDFATKRALAGAAAPEPVKVYVLMGQSNMVGIGQVHGRSRRWGAEMRDPVVSVYEGAHGPNVDYDALEPRETLALASFGGTKPTPFPGGGTRVVRGTVRVEESGTYLFRPGYEGSTQNVMVVAGQEVHRREVGKESRHTPIRLESGVDHPFSITFFTDAADGLGWIERVDVPGTLTTVVKTEGRYPHLLGASGEWAARDDVWYRGVITAKGNQPLTVGCGANARSIGPELGFGQVVGDHHDAPVLLIKASQGNRSLGWDYLPPGGERFTFEGRTYAGYGDRIPSWTNDDPGKEVNWYAGKQYDDCVRAVHGVLDGFEDDFPHHAERGYEIAGFVWWQGHKDGNAAHASRYEQNLVHLIRTLRAEFEAPDAPFVLGTIGFRGWEMTGHHAAVADAQLAIGGGTSGRYPEFAGNVRTVETRDFWRDASASPRDQDFHYNGNAETYLLVGEALGRAMVRLRADR